MTKLDRPGSAEKVQQLKWEFGEQLKFVPADAPVDRVKRTIFEDLQLIRVYTKRPDEKAAKRPIVIPKDSTVQDVARAVHKDFEKGLKFARVWGSTRFAGQQVPREYVLHDKDTVELHI